MNYTYTKYSSKAMSGYKSTCWHLLAWKYQNKSSWDFLGSSVVKNLPSNVGDTGSIPGRGITIPHAMRQLSPRAATTEPMCSRAHMPQPERSPCAAANIQHSQINRFKKIKQFLTKAARREDQWELLTFTDGFSSVQLSSVTQSCPTLCNPMNRCTPGLPVHHQLPEFT